MLSLEIKNLVDAREEFKIPKIRSQKTPKNDESIQFELSDFNYEDLESNEPIFLQSEYQRTLDSLNVQISNEGPIKIEYHLEERNKYLKVKNDGTLRYAPIGNGLIQNPIHDKTLSDGRVVKVGCNTFKSFYTCPDHPKESGQSMPDICRSMKCSNPACHDAWIHDTTERLTSEIHSKIKALKEINSFLQVYHYTISPPQQYAISELQKDLILTDRMYFGNSRRYTSEEKFGLEKLRYEAMQIIKKYSVSGALTGGYMFFHSHRETKKSKRFAKNYKDFFGYLPDFEMRDFYESPHFHILGIITMDYKEVNNPIDRKIFTQTGWVFRQFSNGKRGNRALYHNLKSTIQYEISHASFLLNHDNKRSALVKINDTIIKKKSSKILSETIERPISLDNSQTSGYKIKQKTINKTITITYPKSKYATIKQLQQNPSLYNEYITKTITISQKAITEMIPIYQKSIKVKGSKSSIINYSFGRKNKSEKMIIQFGCFHPSMVKSVDESIEVPKECELCKKLGIEDSRKFRMDDLSIERLPNNEINIHKIDLSVIKNYKRLKKNSIKSGLTTSYQHESNFDYAFSTTYLTEKKYFHHSWIKPEKLHEIIQQNINSLMFFNKDRKSDIQIKIIERLLKNLPISLKFRLIKFEQSFKFDMKYYYCKNQSKSLLGYSYQLKNNKWVKKYANITKSNRLQNSIT